MNIHWTTLGISSCSTYPVFYTCSYMYFNLIPPLICIVKTQAIWIPVFFVWNINWCTTGNPGCLSFQNASGQNPYLYSQAILRATIVECLCLPLRTYLCIWIRNGGLFLSFEYAVNSNRIILLETGERMYHSQCSQKTFMVHQTFVQLK